MAREEKDIFQITDEITDGALEVLMQMELDAANEAAQIMFDALTVIALKTTDDEIGAIAAEAIDMVNREDD